MTRSPAHWAALCDHCVTCTADNPRHARRFGPPESISSTEAKRIITAPAVETSSCTVADFLAGAR